MGQPFVVNLIVPHILEENVKIGDNILDKTNEYFASLNNQTITSLYNLYKIDFEMFNYQMLSGIN